VKKLAHPEKLKSFNSETTKLTLARMLNMFAVLNALKNVKACLNNDFSFYKRCRRRSRKPRVHLAIPPSWP
jgi:cytoplasmic FMR1 interacting protein